ncbi:MAG: hypothetical protein EOM59_07255 [Clostridia bacterium]|nr:hypothetical protein [Clostridia bacterium]
MKKTISILMMILLIVLSLFSGCGKDSEMDFANIYVQGILDTIYLGHQSKEFLDITKIDTLSQLGEEYENGMKAEADYFIYYFNLGSASEQFKEELIDMYKEIYTQAKYEVQASSETGDIYYVDVVIHPIDVIYRFVEEDLASYIESFRISTEDRDFDDLTEEEYDELYASGIIEKVQENIQDLDYYETQTITVEVALHEEDNLYYIQGNGLAEIDAAIIKY